MNQFVSYESAVARLSAQADAVSHLAADVGGFSAVVAAFEARDPNAFRWVLDRIGVEFHCDLICEWVRIKLCVLRCIEICGPVREPVQVPTLRQFADAIAKLTSNETNLRRAVEAVQCGDGKDFRDLISELGLAVHCHLLCHWICTISTRRICELVCTATPVVVADTLTEVRAAAKVVAGLASNERAFEAISKGILKLDCVTVRTAIEQAGLRGHCAIICEWLCVWRCVWVCREICVRPVPVLTGPHAIEEARQFALALRQLAGNPAAIGEMVQAARNRDAKAWAAIVGRYGLGIYCLQLCAWVCHVTCVEFCICICHNPTLQPWFTTVGYFNIYADIDPLTGKTNKALPPASLTHGGGPNFAFWDRLQLGGFCPVESPTSPGVAMKYRFLYAMGGGAPHPITGNLLSPVLAGTRLVNWPQNVGGVAGAGLALTFQSVYIASAPTPPDPVPPLPGAPWYGPSAHYIEPDANGWVVVDPDAIGGGFQTLLGFDTKKVPGLAGGPPMPGVPAGTAVPAANQRAGADLSITFEATRVTTYPPGTTADYSNALDKIHINNWEEVNELWFEEFGTNCCTPIDATLSVQFTVDHEEMDAGAWSLVITSCSPSAPGDITPVASGSGVIVGPRGGSGTIVENTSAWSPCSYTVTLTTRPGQTTGIVDRLALPNSLTFCICGH
ncbi:MAG: hypothetical protein AB7O80_06705 [Acetobacteraceae bacterium]